MDNRKRANLVPRGSSSGDDDDRNESGLGPEGGRVQDSQELLFPDRADGGGAGRHGDNDDDDIPEEDLNDPRAEELYASGNSPSDFDGGHDDNESLPPPLSEDETAEARDQVLFDSEGAVSMMNGDESSILNPSHRQPSTLMTEGASQTSIAAPATMAGGGMIDSSLP